jgi:glucan phosphorylase
MAEKWVLGKRLKNLLNDRWTPIQIIFAGKAHPADDPGKRILQMIVNFARNPELSGRVAFVEDYGELLAQYLVHGVDVWLNNPLPPLEASGTSKAITGIITVDVPKPVAVPIPEARSVNRQSSISASLFISA